MYGERSAAAPHQPGFTGSGSRSGGAAHAGGADATSPSGHPGHGQRATWRCTSPEGRGHWVLLRAAGYTRRNGILLQSIGKITLEVHPGAHGLRKELAFNEMLIVMAVRKLKTHCDGSKKKKKLIVMAGR